MLSKKMMNALNKHLNAELYSWYLYLSMVSFFKDQNLEGFANWMELQAEEEMMHSMKFYNYIIERRGSVTLDEIAKPEQTWKSTLKVFEFTMKHEQKVTALIDDLVILARKEKDNPAEIFLQWFVTEQVEEESNVDAVISRIKLAGDHPGAMFQLDTEMGKRIAAPQV
ncbi:MAG: ferritin [Candidatus Electryonea clarkiae]|nr:ferritin [Candidatus Electryonea clarkiae]MDP8287484.1 ferritin [Candidatus Electryonea clarkiae]